MAISKRWQQKVRILPRWPQNTNRRSVLGAQSEKRHEIVARATETRISMQEFVHLQLKPKENNTACFRAVLFRLDECRSEIIKETSRLV